MSIKAKIQKMQAQKSVEDRVYAAFDQFTEAEEEAVKKVLISLFELNGSEASSKKDFKWAETVKAAAEVKSKGRGRKKGSKNKAKADKVVVEAADKAVEAVAEKAAGRRGRKGSYPTIHDEALRESVLNILREHGNELCMKELISYLLEGEYAEHKENSSFNTRLSSLMKKWCGLNIIQKKGRGLYAVV